MMTVFTFCAVVGGAVLLLLLLGSLLGLGHESAFDGLHGAAHAVDGAGAADGADTLTGHAGAVEDSSHAFNVISFRSIVAAITFFGLGGHVCASAGFPLLFDFAVATGAGVMAMLLVAWMMQLLFSLQHEGTLRLENLVGQPGTCYLLVPEAHSGAGKVTVMVQNRSVEMDAVTHGPAIPTGAGVVVTGLLNSTTVEVKADEA